MNDNERGNRETETEAQGIRDGAALDAAAERLGGKHLDRGSDGGSRDLTFEFTDYAKAMAFEDWALGVPAPNLN